MPRMSPTRLFCWFSRGFLYFSRKPQKSRENKKKHLGVQIWVYAKNVPHQICFCGFLVFWSSQGFLHFSKKNSRKPKKQKTNLGVQIWVYAKNVLHQIVFFRGFLEVFCGFRAQKGQTWLYEKTHGSGPYFLFLSYPRKRQPKTRLVTNHLGSGPAIWLVFPSCI